MATNAGRPRRCSKRWLDGDCPAGVLAIIDYKDSTNPGERFDVIYSEVFGSGHRDEWVAFLSCGVSGSGYHGELRTHEAAAYRYRVKHRYATWSSLPDAVKAAVRNDLAVSA